MSNIFALKGKGNSGKTETLKTIFHNLQAKYPTATVNVLISNTVDIKIIMDINGTKVGIESQGDPHPRLEQSLSDFVNAKCDIIICATRTRGKTVKWVNSHSKQYNTRFILQSKRRVGRAIAKPTILLGHWATKSEYLKRSLKKGPGSI